MNVQAIIEATLMAAGKALSVEDIKRVFKGADEMVSSDTVKETLQNIADNCENLGFELKKLSSGYRFQVKQEYASWVSKLWEEKPPKYSKALLEIIAIIAYKQPVTRAEIEEIRGVAVSTNAIRSFLDKQWIKVVAHKDIPGKPAVYGTTKEFLDHFNLESLTDLPEIDLSKIEFSKEVDDSDEPQMGFNIEDAIEAEEAIENEEIVSESSDSEANETENDIETKGSDSVVIDASEEFLKKKQENQKAHDTEDVLEVYEAEGSN